MLSQTTEDAHSRDSNEEHQYVLASTNRPFDSKVIGLRNTIDGFSLQQQKRSVRKAQRLVDRAYGRPLIFLCLAICPARRLRSEVVAMFAGPDFSGVFSSSKNRLPHDTRKTCGFSSPAGIFSRFFDHRANTAGIYCVAIVGIPSFTS